MTGGSPRVVVLAGGVGGSRFCLGVRAALARRPDAAEAASDPFTVVVNTGDDLWLSGVRLQPDVDSIVYALAGVNDTERGWGRDGDSERVNHELQEWGAGWPWFTLGDLDLGTHLARTGWLRDGLTPTEVLARMSRRWPLGARLLPMTDAEVDTIVAVADPSAPLWGSGRVSPVSELSSPGLGRVSPLGAQDLRPKDADAPQTRVSPASDGAEASPAPAARREMHFQVWWTRHRASLKPVRFDNPGIEHSAPSPGVLEAIAAADVVLLAPSNPVVSIGPILAVPGIREALRRTPGRVVGVSPIIGGRVVRGMADVCLQAIGVDTDAAAVAAHYGARSDGARADGAGSHGGLLDAWLLAEEDAASADQVADLGIRPVVTPLWMRDAATSAALADAALRAAGL